MSDDQPVRAVLVPLNSGDAGHGLKLAELTAATRRVTPVILGVGFACIAAFAIAYYLADTKFRATTTFILVDQSQGISSLGALGSQLGGFADLAGLSLQGSSGIREEAYATLESRELLRKFITDEGLIPILFSEKWNSQASVWETDTGEAPSIEKAITFFRENVLEIRREPNRNIVDLSITWVDPLLCAKWANHLVMRVNEDLRVRSKIEASESIEFLEQELESNSNAELQSAIFALIEQQMAQTMMANVRTDFAFRIIDPAAVPDADDRVSPRLLLFLIAGGATWVLISGLIILVSAFRNRSYSSSE